ncbi:MAG: DoxX family protein [Chloroflexi bacterium]|nr:DoxX family protein [Chloroflexota bacterium]
MNIVLWILQGLLAFMFLMAGMMKISQTKDGLKEKGAGRMDWVDDVSPENIKLIGILEILGALGLVLPQLTGILPWLTPLAAVGLALTMAGATVLHARRSDPLVPTIMLLLFAAFVAYGRFVLIPA